MFTPPTLCFYPPFNTLRWFNVKCGKIECQNRFCINLTINLSIFFKNGLGIFYDPKLFKLRTEIWFIIKLSIRRKISLKTLKIAFEINFVPHFYEETTKRAPIGSYEFLVSSALSVEIYLFHLDLTRIY